MSLFKTALACAEISCQQGSKFPHCSNAPHQGLFNKCTEACTCSPFMGASADSTVVFW